MGTFEVREQFYLNGKPFRIIAGAIHYFRVPREYWRDRLLKLRAMGCNTVETYTAWNLHELQQGGFDFSGNLDVAAFLSLAQELGLYAIVRPSPFICAEWEFGGLPAWLLSEQNMPLRSSEGPFLSYVESYYKRLFCELKPLLITNGGPILMMQVENEFGAWCRPDKPYLRALRDLMKQCGADVPLFTADPVEGLENGTVEDVLPTVNLGSDVENRFRQFAPYVKDAPYMVAELWLGWFDAWGKEHHTNPAETCAQVLDDILKTGASVNLYMFHGGTNPGLWSGANDYGHIEPDTTSYDYDAPLAEDGSITPKYLALREVIAKYTDFDKTLPAPLPQGSFGTLCADGCVGLFEALETLSAPQYRTDPVSMERLGQNIGYTLYRTVIPKRCTVETLEFAHCADRAQIFIDGVPVKTVYDREASGKIAIGAAVQKGARLDILTENLGRVNYGGAMEWQRKGLDGTVLLNGTPLQNWEIYPLEFTPAQLGQLAFKASACADTPSITRFRFRADAPCDTFLHTDGWGKGLAFINGVTLGRFWSIGPQERLFIPAPLLQCGENELLILETEGLAAPTVSLTTM